MTLKTFVSTILLLCVQTWSVLANPQTDGSVIAAIKTGDGYVIVWNQSDIHFTLGLKGKDVRPMGTTRAGSAAFIVDGVVFQVQSVAIDEFVTNSRRHGLTEQAILVAHRDWESNYLEQTLGTTLDVTSSPQYANNGLQALLWKFDIPSDTARQQLFLTTVSGTEVVVLSGTAEGSAPVSENEIQKLLLDSMATLRVSAVPIDVLKVRESLH